MASVEDRMGRAFGLTGERWLRHANPWSVYTRIPIPVALAATVWTRAWIGWWCLVPVAVVCVWTAINPRAFPAPDDLDAWASRAVLGETFWSARGTVPVPSQHRVAPIVLTLLNSAGIPLMVWGLVAADPGPTVLGLCIQSAGKLWFLDRMVWLYDDMVALGHRPDIPMSGDGDEASEAGI